MKPMATLPQPSADALAHSQRVRAYVEQKLGQQQGWISLHDYIEAVLYAPGLGYYTSGAKKLSNDTDGSDFVTAPELSPLFARTWSVPIADALTKSKQANILELGAGSGTFAAELLTTFAKNDIAFSTYSILERSADLRERQHNLLQQRAPQFLDRIIWLNSLPESFDGVVFMNEVLDALPPHVVLRQNGEWFEQGVTQNDAQQLALMAKPLHDDSLRAIAEKRFPVSGDYQAEINLGAEALVETLSRMLAASGSNNTLFICDYGFERDQTLPEQYAHGTLRVYYRHHLLDDVLIYPGLADITAHIDFVAILEAAQRGGMVLMDFQPQRDWLIEHGVLDLLQEEKMASTAYLMDTKTVHTMITSEAMGEIFKTLVLMSKP
jgi:Uncharacterized conserved protein